MDERRHITEQLGRVKSKHLNSQREVQKKGQGGQSEHISRQKKNDRQQCRRGRKCIKGQ